MRHDLNSNNGTQADVQSTIGILEHGRLRAGLCGQLTWGEPIVRDDMTWSANAGAAYRF